MKVDCQAGVGLLGSAMGGGPAVAQQYHIALEKSIKKHFPGNDCINCMCHSTENFYRQACCAIFLFACWSVLPQPSCVDPVHACQMSVIPDMYPSGFW